MFVPMHFVRPLQTTTAQPTATTSTATAVPTIPYGPGGPASPEAICTAVGCYVDEPAEHKPLEVAPVTSGHYREQIEKKPGVGGGVVLGADGMGASGTTTNGQHQTKGSVTATAKGGTVSADWKKYDRNPDAEDAELRHGASGSAGVELTEHGYSANAEGQVQVRGAKVTVKGGLSVEARVVQPPRGKTGPWKVEWKSTTEQSVGGGYEDGPGMSGSRATASSRFGTAVFETEGQAQAFADHGASRIEEMQPRPTTAAAALAMAEGETRGRASTTTYRGDIGGEGGAAKAGVGATNASGGEESVTRTGKSTVQVTATTSATNGVHGRIGIPFTSAGRSGTDTGAKQIVVEFDLAKPQDRAAYEMYMQSGQVTGGREVQRSEGMSRTDATELAVGPASARRGSRIEDKQVHRDGHVIDIKSGHDEAAYRLGALGVELAHYDASTGLRTIEVDGKRSAYVVDAHVDSSDGDSSHEGLAEATGTTQQHHAAHRASGKWSIEAQVAEKDMDHFIDSAMSDRFNASALLGKADLGEDLQVELRAAKTSNERRAILTRFTAKGGGKALDVIRDNLPADEDGKRKQLDYDLKLENDANFTGVDGRLEREREIDGLGRGFLDAGTNPDALRALAGRAAALEAQELRRRNAIANEKRYTDLPADLRKGQIAKSQAMIDRIAELRQHTEMRAIAAIPRDSELAGELFEYDRAMASAGRIDSMYTDSAKNLDVHDHAASRAAYEMRQKAKALEPAIRDARSNLVAAMSNPKQSRAAAQKLTTLVTLQQQLNEDAANKMFEASSRFRRDADNGYTET